MNYMTRTLQENLDHMIFLLQRYELETMFRTYYHTHFKAIENFDEPRYGLDTALQCLREQESRFKILYFVKPLFYCLKDNTQIVHTEYEYQDTNRQFWRHQNYTKSKWEDGKIIEEHYLYPTAQKIEAPSQIEYIFTS